MMGYLEWKFVQMSNTVRYNVTINVYEAETAVLL